MNVLGLHGVYDRSHDSSACLVSNSTLPAYVEEERFTRTKKAFDTPPHNAITYCLESTGTDVGELDAITSGWKGKILSDRDFLPPYYLDRLHKDIPVEQIEHHEAHAASVFYTSPFAEAAVLIVDGQGESESSSIWAAGPEGLNKLESIGIDRSLGYLYAAISKFCGLGTFGAGKVMGLAPYGQARYTDVLADLYDSISLDKQETFDSQDAYFNQFLGALNQLGFSPARMASTYSGLDYRLHQQPELTDIHKDMAASVQELLEEKMLELAAKAKQLTGSDNLCLAGGVAMNCVANSRIQDSGIFTDLFMQPGCEDCGVAMGSALALQGKKVPLPSPYLGPAFSDEQIAAVIESQGLKAVPSDDIVTDTADRLANGQIVGWFQGGLEYGPRALGGRSILANPSDGAMQDRVNNIKRREQWRPFGPSVIAEEAERLFENSYASPYMLRSFTVRDAWRDALAAVVHVDGTTRPQTVSESDNPRFRKLLDTFHRMSGIPGVLNTSFNNYDEPIVATPADALKTFHATGLDALAIGNFLITQRS